MRSITNWHPFRSLARRDDSIEDLFRDFFRDVESGELAPAAEVTESEGEVTVKLEVPGVEQKDLHVTVSDDAISVRGETRKEVEEKKKSFYRQEIRYGAFERTVPLPAEVDPAKAAAKLHNGMLTVTLPKAAQAKAKRVEVAVG